MKKLMLIMIIAAAAFASCEKIEIMPTNKIPVINVITGEAYLMYDVFKIKIDPETKAGFNAERIPIRFTIECIETCSFTVNGKFYNKSANINLYE